MDAQTSSTSHLPPTPPSELASESEKRSAAKEVVSALAVATAAHTEATTPTTTTYTPSTTHKHIWIITGPAGSGKTSVAQHLHDTLGFPYLEGDTFHTPANIEKMAQGQPLTDSDRWDWLILLRETALSTLLGPPSTPETSQHDPQPEPQPGPPNPLPTNVLLTSSCLKRRYRDVLRIASYTHPTVQVHFLFLSASEAELMARVRGRQGHYMKDYMVRSQFESLEMPGEDEGDVLEVDAGSGEGEVGALAVEAVRGFLAED